MEQWDLRQLLLHRHKLVSMRAQVKNQLQHLAMNQGVQRKSKRIGQRLVDDSAWGKTKR
jgi:hypothetical protein